MDSHSTAQQESMDQSSKANIEAIMRDRYPLLPLIHATASIEEFQNRTGQTKLVGTPSTPSAVQMKAEADTFRAHLESLPVQELAELGERSRQRLAAQAAAERAKKEATRFYNQPGAMADFFFWCKAEYWTADEAAALLLGRDPRVVKPETLAAELSPPKGLFSLSKAPAPAEFHRQFDGLRALLSRASGLQRAALTPRAALEWSLRTNAVNVPPALAAALHTESNPEASADGSAIPATLVTPQSRGTPIRWSPEMLEKLRACRDQRGAKAAAEEFGISEARVRQLLPRSKEDEPKAGAFGAMVHRLR